MLRTKTIYESLNCIEAKSHDSVPSHFQSYKYMVQGEAHAEFLIKHGRNGLLIENKLVIALKKLLIKIQDSRTVQSNPTC